MSEWSLYPAIIGTCLSVWLWLRFVVRNHDKESPMTLSELGAQTDARYFRFVLWLCGPLFGITIVFYLGPRIASPWIVYSLVLVVLFEVLAGVFLPRTTRGKVLHGIAAYGMAICMFVSAVGLALSLQALSWALWLLVAAMLVCAIMAGLRHGRFLVYELAFIFLSHISMVAASVILAVT